MTCVVTHEIVVLPVKPPDGEIEELCREYFSLQAGSYDAFDAEIQKRRDYCRTIDQLALSAIEEIRPKRVLSFGCGTGRREANIQSVCTCRFKVVGIEASYETAKLAEKRGLEVYRHSGEVMRPESFDIIMALASFGHIPSTNARSAWLCQFWKALPRNGVLILDVFNVHDRTEWGPQITRRQKAERWLDRGYEPGDVFYRRRGWNGVAFLHYFSAGEIVSMVERSGFVISTILSVGYGKDPGEMVRSLDLGNLYIVARKRGESL